MPARQLDRRDDARGSRREHDRGRRHPQRQQPNDDEVRERPKRVVAGVFGRRAALARALEQPRGLRCGRRGILEVVSEVEGWSEVDGALEREFRFDTYLQGIGFVDRLAAIADGADHHPDITIGYKRVTVRWSTHSAGGITDRDRELAERTNELG